jgi:hypothetical protein
VREILVGESGGSVVSPDNGISIWQELALTGAGLMELPEIRSGRRGRVAVDTGQPRRADLHKPVKCVAQSSQTEESQVLHRLARVPAAAALAYGRRADSNPLDSSGAGHGRRGGVLPRTAAALFRTSPARLRLRALPVGTTGSHRPTSQATVVRARHGNCGIVKAGQRG